MLQVVLHAWSVEDVCRDRVFVDVRFPFVRRHGFATGFLQLRSPLATFALYGVFVLMGFQTGLCTGSEGMLEQL